jgi:hypothetical protein
VRVLSRLFRRLFLDGLIALFDAGELSSSAIWPASPIGARSSPISRRCAKAEWVVYAKRRSPAPSRCSPISRATRIASPSPTAGSSS